MALKFTGRRYHDDQTGTVTFPAWNGQARVNCRITDEALMFLFGAARTDSGLLDTFDRNRASIEVTAACKFDSAGDAINITLASRDFPDKKPAGAPDPGAAAADATGRAARDPRAAAQNAEKIERFRRHARDLESAKAIDPDVAAWNAETAALLGKLDADLLMGVETEATEETEPTEEEAAGGTKR